MCSEISGALAYGRASYGLSPAQVACCGFTPAEGLSEGRCRTAFLGWVRQGLGRKDGLRQVGFQVLDLLEPDREAEQTWADRRIVLAPPLHQRLDAPERGGVLPQHQLRRQGFRRPFGVKLQREGAAEPAFGGRLGPRFQRDGVARRRRQRRVPHLANEAVQRVGRVGNRTVEPARQVRRAQAVALEPQGERAEGAQQEPRLHRPGDAADVAPLPLELGVELGGGDAKRAADGVGVAGEVLGRAVHHGRGAQGERPLQRGRGEGGVHDHAELAGKAGVALDVKHLTHWVAGRLEPDQVAGR
mmetsp:Transcript_5581/g.10475  ORF Transcript_5581/g.10475 Transcript_5581/m.10475 type:complete len:301 (+) Transcript_5581:119-1021(+)